MSILPKNLVGSSVIQDQRVTRVTVPASLRDLAHDGRWSTYDENVRKLSRVSLPEGPKSTLVKNKHTLPVFPPSCSSPLITEEDLPGMLLSWCLVLLNITGLEALGSAKRYGTPSKASLISKTRLAGSYLVSFVQGVRL